MKITKPALVAFALLVAPHGAMAGGAGAAIDAPPVVIPQAVPVAKTSNMAPWLLVGLVAAGAAVALSSR